MVDGSIDGQWSIVDGKANMLIFWTMIAQHWMLLKDNQIHRSTLHQKSTSGEKLQKGTSVFYNAK